MAPANSKPAPFTTDSETGDTLAPLTKEAVDKAPATAPDDWRDRYAADQAAQRRAPTRFDNRRFRRKEDTSGG